MEKLAKKNWHTLHGEVIENALLGVGALFIAAILWILIQDISFLPRRSKNSATRDVVAHLRMTENIVRKKVDGLLLWDTAKKSDDLALDDQVFTDENSWAEIEFDDAAKVSVAQKSLVIVRRSGRERLLDLQSGTIKAQLSSDAQLLLQIRQTTSRLSSSDGAYLQIEAKPNQNPNITVLEGNVDIERDAQKISIKKNQRVQLEENLTSSKVQPALLSLLEPDDGATLVPTESVHFKWAQKDAHPSLLEISQDQSFHKTLIVQETSQQEFITQLKEGSYFWRVSHADGETSPTRRLKVALPFQLLNPVHGLVTKDVRIYFDWVSHLRDASQTLEIATNSTFDDAQIHKRSELPFLAPALKDGHYYWRVCAQTAAKSICSAVREFDIGEKPEEIAPPVLDPNYRLQPRKTQGRNEHNLYERIGNFFLGIFISEAYADEGNVISWKAVPGAVRYDVQLSKQENFAIIIREKSVVQPTLAIEDLTAGTYYLRVRTVSASGSVSAFSSPSSISIAYPEMILLSPGEGQQIEKKGDLTPVEFSWKEITGIESFQYQLFSQKIADKPIVNEVIRGTKTTRSFTRSGDFYWRVGHLADGDQWEWSALRKITITPDKVQAPQLPAIIKIKKNTFPESQQNDGAAVEFEVPRRVKSETTSISLGANYERIDAVTTGIAHRDHISFKGYKSFTAAVDIRLSERFGLKTIYRYLQTKIFKDETYAATQNIRLGHLQSSVRYDLDISTLAESRLSFKLGYLRSDVPLLERQNGLTVMRFHRAGGITPGFGFGRSLTSSIWFEADADLLIPMPMTKKFPTHLLLGGRIFYLLKSGLYLGPTADIEYAKYQFESEKVALRRETYGARVGYHF